MSHNTANVTQNLPQTPLPLPYSHANNGENDHQAGVENVGDSERNAQNDAQHADPLAVYTEISGLEFFHKRHVVC